MDRAVTVRPSPLGTCHNVARAGRHLGNVWRFAVDAALGGAVVPADGRWYHDRLPAGAAGFATRDAAVADLLARAAREPGR